MSTRNAKSEDAGLAEVFDQHNRKRFEHIRSNNSADDHLIEAYNTCASSEIDLNTVEFGISDEELGLDPLE